MQAPKSACRSGKKVVILQSRLASQSQRMTPGELKALNASGCSPVRLTPVVGVTTGAHYRMSTGHSSPAKIKNFRAPLK